MPDTEHSHDLTTKMKTDAPVADTEPILGRFDILKPFHIAGAGCDEALDSFSDAACDAVIERRHVCNAASVHSISLTPGRAFA